MATPVKRKDVDDLIAILQNDGCQSLTRIAAINLIGIYGGADALRGLDKFLQDKDTNVASAAEKALKRIRRQGRMQRYWDKVIKYLPKKIIKYLPTKHGKPETIPSKETKPTEANTYIDVVLDKKLDALTRIIAIDKLSDSTSPSALKALDDVLIDPKVKSAAEKAMKRIAKRGRINFLGLIAILLPLILIVIKVIQEILKYFSPDKVRNNIWMVLYISISVIVALIISFLLWLAFKKIRVKPGVEKLRARANSLPTLAIGAICSIPLIFITYFVGSRTDLWQITQSRLKGPQIDLASKSLEKTAQPIINLPWFNYGQDFGQVSGWGSDGVSGVKYKEVEERFKALAGYGIKAVVWFLLFDGRGSPEFNSDGYVTGLDQDFWKDYDTAIEIARKHNVGIVWALIDYQWMLPAKQERGASLFGHMDVIENPDKRKSFFDNALVPILERYKHESQICGWVLINEPENALKEGYIKFEPVNEFVREATALVRKHTHRQPVTVGSADLESLLEYWGKDSVVFDFFVFHHYAPFAPPPVSRVRSLMPGAGDKPIYVGEFEIKAPPIPLGEFVTKSRGFGYAGLWPWSLNDGKDESASPRFEQARLLSQAVSGSGSVDSSQSKNWWNQHRGEAVIPWVNLKNNERQSAISDHERNFEVNRNFEENTLRLLDDLNRQEDQANTNDAGIKVAIRDKEQRIHDLERQIADDERTLDQLNRNLPPLQNQLKELKVSLANLLKTGGDTTQVRKQISGIDADISINSANIQRVNSNLDRLRNNLAVERRSLQELQNRKLQNDEYISQIKSQRGNQEQNLKLARERMALHRALAAWNRYQLLWARELYLNDPKP